MGDLLNPWGGLVTPWDSTPKEIAVAKRPFTNVREDIIERAVTGLFGAHATKTLTKEKVGELVADVVYRVLSRAHEYPEVPVPHMTAAQVEERVAFDISFAARRIFGFLEGRAESARAAAAALNGVEGDTGWLQTTRNELSFAARDYAAELHTFKVLLDRLESIGVPLDKKLIAGGEESF